MISFAGYPLLVEGRTVGVIAMFARQFLEQDAIEALESVAPVIAAHFSYPIKGISHPAPGPCLLANIKRRAP